VGSAPIGLTFASDGALLGTFAVGTCPAAVALDGANVWVTDCKGSVSKL